MSIRMNDFDELESNNTHPIHLVMHRIKVTAPAGSKVTWQYPGYISIVLENGTEIAFGESLESDGAYSWNTYDLEGNSNFCDSFADPKDLDAIATTLWAQTAPAIAGK